MSKTTPIPTLASLLATHAAHAAHAALDAAIAAFDDPDFEDAVFALEVGVVEGGVSGCPRCPRGLTQPRHTPAPPARGAHQHASVFLGLWGAPTRKCVSGPLEGTPAAPPVFLPFRVAPTPQSAPPGVLFRSARNPQGYTRACR